MLCESSGGKGGGILETHVGEKYERVNRMDVKGNFQVLEDWWEVLQFVELMECKGRSGL